MLILRQRTWLVWPLALAGGVALGLASRLVLFVLGLVLLRAGSQVAAVVLGPLGWADPVYTHAMLRSLGDVHLAGLAVAGGPGAVLHDALPGLVTEPARAHLAVVRVVVQPGSALLGRLVAAAFAHAGTLGLGVLLVASGVRRHRAALALAGLAVQAQVALSILGAQPSVRELESTGLSFAMNALLPWLWQRGQAVGDRLATVPSPLLPAGLVGLALGLGYVPAALLAALKRRARLVTLGSAIGVTLVSVACAGALQPAPPPAAPVVRSAQLMSVAIDLPPTPGPAPTQPSPTQAVLASDRWFGDTPLAPQQPGPSHVEVRGGGGHFQYLVNGQPQIIKGMGLNTQYAQQLSPEARAAQLDADMAALDDLGVNTVLGWDPAEFDTVLLNAAQRHHIGVVMPFDLDPSADYTDPELRQTLHDQVMAWVATYRDHPALRMWGLGNEVLHKIVHPAWVGPQDPQRELNAEAFSDWLVETADAIHAADPDHPVTYRSAEDAFVPWVVAALARHGGGPRPWFVWGTNCYQPYLAQILDNWPDSGMASAIWVSEFAPGTLPVPDRPDGFERMWGDIRAHPDWVLGGAVYAWTRNGPEGVDRNFGLTDDGTPVDGRSLDRLRVLFHSE